MTTIKLHLYPQGDVPFCQDWFKGKCLWYGGKCINNIKCNFKLKEAGT